MKLKLIFLATAATLCYPALAQDSYGGLGLPGLVTLGYAKPFGSNWGLRGEFAGGLNLNRDGDQNGVKVTGTLKANRVGAYADWFPFDNEFRLVGGISVNDIKASFKGIGSPTTQINGVTVDTTGKIFNVDLTYPSTTPYFGIGYGHSSKSGKGLGFYADAGFLVGTFNTSITENIVSSGTLNANGTPVTQADIDAQTKSMRDSVSSLSVLPSVSIGVTYRY